LADVLDTLPPALILIDAEDHRWGAMKTDQPTSSAATGDELKLAPAFQFEEAEAAPRPAGKTAISPTARPKRRPKNPFVEVAKIVAGGIVGIILAILIMWWGLGRDPMEWADDVSRYTPWIVPANLRGNSPPETEANDDLNSSTPRRDTSGGGKLASASAGNKPAQAKDANRNTSLETDNAVASSAANSLPADLTPPFDLADPTANQAIPEIPELTMPDFEPTLEFPEPKRDEEQFTGVRNAPQMDSGDLAKALREAVAANEALDMSQDLDDEQRKQLALDFYRFTARLGEVLAYVNQNDPENQEHLFAIHQLLTQFGKQPNKLRQIGILADWWGKQPEPANSGVVHVGTVTEVAAAGRLIEAKIEVATKPSQTISVVTANNPGELLKTGTKVLFLGAVVQEPSINLGGYEGNSPEVIAGGYFVPVPEPQSKEDSP
jgi:hypothetical protein